MMGLWRATPALALEKNLVGDPVRLGDGFILRRAVEENNRIRCHLRHQCRLDRWLLVVVDVLEGGLPGAIYHAEDWTRPGAGHRLRWLALGILIPRPPWRLRVVERVTPMADPFTRSLA